MSMPRGGKSYIDNLTHQDRVICVMVKDRRVFHGFTVQYEAKLDKIWVAITRIDTSHGFAHRHKFSPINKDVITPFVCNNYREGFTLARHYIKNNYQKLRENYLTQANKRRL